MNNAIIDQVRFDENGLVPAVIQDVHSGEVLVLAYMNRDSLRLTLERGETHFWSRRRQELWHKGETSGNVQRVRGIWYDCDADTLLVKVEQVGVACHTGAYSCFFSPVTGREDSAVGFGEVVGSLARVIHRRNVERPEGSYTVKLLDGGMDRILKKVSEESGEVLIAAKNESGAEIAWEVADLTYHLLVMLEAAGVSLDDVAVELKKREGKRREG